MSSAPGRTWRVTFTPSLTALSLPPEIQHRIHHKLPLNLPWFIRISRSFWGIFNVSHQSPNRGNTLRQKYFTKTESALIDTLFELIKRNLQNGEDVLISGLGRFSVKEKHQRKGRNPQTGKAMTLPPRKAVTFKCSNVLRAVINAEVGQWVCITSPFRPKKNQTELSGQIPW